MADSSFSELQLDALKETMNIGFGQAAAALSEVIDMHVVLNVPEITKLEPHAIASFVCSEVDTAAFSMVEQFFLGHFNGTSFLLLPVSESQKLVSLFSGDVETDASVSLDSLERETIVEIGNIIIGACVGKIAEMLGDVVTYLPPRFFAGPIDDDFVGRHLQPAQGLALVFKTIFHFDAKDVSGLLFLVTGNDSAVWLKRAVDAVLDGLTG
jgi:chemotaxis protein CheC